MTRRSFFPIASAAPFLPAPLKITRLSTRKHSIGNHDYLFVEIETDGQSTGLAEASISGRIDIVEKAVHFYTPHLVNREAAGIEEHWNRNYYELSRYRNGPVLMTALSAIAQHLSIYVEWSVMWS